MSKKTKALVVFSGGLDSILAIRLLQDQNIAVSALTFESNFYNADKARLSAQLLGVDLLTVNIETAMLDLIKNPPNGFGKNLNPCIDCHGLMFRLAGQKMQAEGYDILASGEVLGQRPFSQTKVALGRVTKLAGTEILRPLSAKILPETVYERNGLVDRNKLESISGRSRDAQQALARKYNIDYYPSPGGGCLLTDPGYSKRLKEMLDKWPECSIKDVELLRSGRVFWLTGVQKDYYLLIVGRHQKDNERLLGLAQKGDIVLQLKEINGPVGLLRGLKLTIEKEITINIPSILEPDYFTVKDGVDIIKKASLISFYHAGKARGQAALALIKSY